MKLYEPFTFAIITLLLLAGWGAGLGWGFEHIKAECLRHNAVVTDRGAQGPLQLCGR